MIAGSLYRKLAAVLLGLFLLLGIAFAAITGYAVNLYQQEVVQKLNRDLAHHIILETRTLVHGQRVDQAALKDLFDKMMTVNPGIEIYLLDLDGTLLAYSAKPQLIKRQRVDLAPLRTLLQPSARLPILGDDPRDPFGKKIFSAAPIPAQGAPEAYLYVILGGQAYDSVAHLVQGSYMSRLGLLGIGLSLLFVLLAGLLLFALLTRRLRFLTRAVEAFQQQQFESPFHFTPRARRGDEIDRLGSVFRDVAERLRDQMQTLKNTDRLRRELVANVSHDLRTPLAALQGYLETVLRKHGQLDAEQEREYLQIAHKHSERLGRLIAELFELAKLDANEVAVHPEVFSLGELAQDLAQEFRLAAEKKGVDLVTEVDPDLPFVRADIGLIQRALSNLMDNALRYTESGGQVRLRLQARTDRIETEVTDTGCGIAAEDLPHIFERFYRATSPHRPQSEGSGLGLAIAKRIIELHGTRLEVDSAPGQGSRFRFALPIHDPHRPVSAPIRERVNHS